MGGSSSSNAAATTVLSTALLATVLVPRHLRRLVRGGTVASGVLLTRLVGQWWLHRFRLALEVVFKVVVDILIGLLTADRLLNGGGHDLASAGSVVSTTSS